MEKPYKNSSITRYVDDLAAKLPAPGGGSAAAMSACLGISLVSMVVNFTLGKPKYARYQKELEKMLSESERLRSDFLNLVDLDVVAYKSRNLRDALNVPFMLARLCFEGAKLCPPLVTKGNANLVSDVAVAAELLESAFAAACCNVEINLKMLGDKGLARQMRKELAGKGKSIKKIRLNTEERVNAIIRG